MPGKIHYSEFQVFRSTDGPGVELNSLGDSKNNSKQKPKHDRRKGSENTQPKQILSSETESEDECEKEDTNKISESEKEKNKINQPGKDKNKISEPEKDKNKISESEKDKNSVDRPSSVHEASETSHGGSPSGDKNENSNGKEYLKDIGMFALKTAGLSAVVIGGTALALPLIGFGALGPIGGSLAAAYQSAALGGTIASGSVFATLQSVGMVGLSAAAKSVVVAGSAAASAAHTAYQKQKDDKEEKK